jgi:hypothetical protein
MAAYMKRDNSVILKYKKNKKPLLNFPSETDLHDFIGTVLRKGLEEEGVRYLKTEGFRTWAKLTTRDPKATAEYLKRVVDTLRDKDGNKIIKISGDALWADITKLSLHEINIKPTQKTIRGKLPSGRQKIVTGTIKNIGDTPIRNILLKFEMISKVSGRRVSIAVGMIKQRSDFVFLKHKGKRPRRFLPHNEETTPLKPNETTWFEARTPNEKNYIWNDDPNIDMAIPFHKGISYEMFYDGAWVKVGTYGHKTKGYFFTSMSLRIKRYYKDRKRTVRKDRSDYRSIRPKIKYLVQRKLDNAYSKSTYGFGYAKDLTSKAKHISLNYIKSYVLKLKNEKVFLNYTGSSSKRNQG